TWKPATNCFGLISSKGFHSRKSVLGSSLRLRRKLLKFLAFVFTKWVYRITVEPMPKEKRSTGKTVSVLSIVSSATAYSIDSPIEPAHAVIYRPKPNRPFRDKIEGC